MARNIGVAASGIASTSEPVGNSVVGSAVANQTSRSGGSAADVGCQGAQVERAQAAMTESNEVLTAFVAA